MTNKLRIKGLRRVQLLLRNVDPWKVRPECQGCHDRVPIRHMWRWQRTGLQRCSACLLLWYVEELESPTKEDHKQ